MAIRDGIDLEKMIKEALDTAFYYGGFDGAHHKTWVIDQMVRCLLAEKYDKWVEEVCSGNDGPDTYEWDTGIAP